MQITLCCTDIVCLSYICLYFFKLIIKLKNFGPDLQSLRKEPPFFRMVVQPGWL